jgi:hypothetical protein
VTTVIAKNESRRSFMGPLYVYAHRLRPRVLMVTATPTSRLQNAGAERVMAPIET